jgi:hypothetical protein
VKPGEIDPNAVVVPGIFVHRIVEVEEDPRFPRHLETNFQVSSEQ